jgi:release factor glutamine methyltransferase
MIPPLNPKEVDWLLAEKYQGVSSPAFLADVERLKVGEPLAYVIGWIPFYDCKIDVSLHPMIPRPETEFWVERAVRELEALNKKTLRLADTYSGSGCIGVALLKHLPYATADISELDPKLTEQLKLNVRFNGIDESRARCFAADGLEGLTGEYDAIFANPPYIDPAAIPEMDESVVNFEPHLSLFSGERGLDQIKIIIRDGAALLVSGGTFYVECDAHQREWIDEIVATHNATATTKWNHEFWFDQYGQIRFLILRKP